MKRFINFGSIDQFRNIIKNVQNSARFQGLDESGEPIYKDVQMPVVDAMASEKIHGTNAAVCYSEPDGFWVQSRKNIITPEKDNAGCAFFCEQNKDEWMDIINELKDFYYIDLNKNIISVYFEWAGGSIQKNSACSGMDKRAIIFQHFKISPIEKRETMLSGEEFHSKWYETSGLSGWVNCSEKNIYNIMLFTKWSFVIDFEHPVLYQNKFIEVVENDIEPNSPVGHEMGIDGNIGEGMVVTFMYKDTLHRFKVKGEKHSRSKVKTLKSVDLEKEQAKIDFANYSCKAFRLEQAWEELFGIDNEKQGPTVKLTGEFLRLVTKDIIKEESDIMAEKGLEPKEIGRDISKIAKTWFMEQLDKEAGL